MITSEPTFVYLAECDICKSEFEHPYEGWTTFLNQDYMTDSMSSAGWHIDDNNSYCPKCHHIDDEDNLFLKTTEVK